VHYASISTDPEYIEPYLKHTVNKPDVEYVSEWSMFNALDTLRATATGHDEIPAWFLRLGAPVFAKPLVQLLNLSISTSIVPVQWKQASICPDPKTACPREHSDFHPISITSVLFRISERLIITRQFLYPAFLLPPSSLNLTGSTTAALISIFDSVTRLLACNNNQPR